MPKENAWNNDVNRSYAFDEEIKGELYKTRVFGQEIDRMRSKLLRFGNTGIDDIPNKYLAWRKLDSISWNTIRIGKGTAASVAISKI